MGTETREDFKTKTKNFFRINNNTNRRRRLPLRTINAFKQIILSKILFHFFG